MEREPHGRESTNVLMIGRRSGQGLYIGRDIRATVTSTDKLGMEVIVETPLNVAVTASGEDASAHVAAQFKVEGERQHPGKRTSSVRAEAGQWVRIGRGVSIMLMGLEEREGRYEAKLGINAPRHVAVSRDDFTWEQHLAFVRKRELRTADRR